MDYQRVLKVERGMNGQELVKKSRNGMGDCCK